MSNGMVSFRDYEGVAGFGLSNQQEVDDLNKALTTGTAFPASSGGGVLRVESLEATLRVLTFTLANIKFWKKIPKMPAFSTVEEYNILTDYGADNGVFTAEGALPEVQDTSYARKSQLVKFLGVTGDVSHPATMVRPAHGNVLALETQNKTQWLIERIERALFSARSDYNTLAFDGVDRQILDGAGITTPWSTDPTTASGGIVIDLRGGQLTEDYLEQGCNTVVEQYGTPTELYLTPRAMSDLSKSFYPKERINLPYPTQGQVGLAVTSFVSSAGTVEFNSDVFLRPGRNNGVKAVQNTASSTKAPNAPTTVTIGAPTGSDGKFVAADAGVYTYAATAVNQYGESAYTAGSGTATIAATNHVPITIVDGGAGGGAATSYRIYRTKAGGAVGTAQLMIEVPAATGVAGFNDYNYWIPGCSKSYLFQNNMANFSFRQLAPMMKIPLATIAASIRWMQLLYGTPIVYTPKKNVVYINVSDG
jgi:hypothetical protein